MQQPIQDPPKKKLWQGLKERGGYTKSYQEFEAKYSTPEAVDFLWKGMSDNGDYTKSREEFELQYFPELKKKEQPQPKPSDVGGVASSVSSPSGLQSQSDIEHRVTLQESVTPTQPKAQVEPTEPTIPIEDFSGLGLIDKVQKASKLGDVNVPLPVTSGGVMQGGLGGSDAYYNETQSQKRKKELEQKKQLKKQIAESGIDPDVAELVLSDLQFVDDAAKQNLEQKLINNPQLGIRTAARLKWRAKLDDEFAKREAQLTAEGKTEEVSRLKTMYQNLGLIGGTKTYQDQRKAVQSVSELIDATSLENRDEIKKILSEEAKFNYGARLAKKEAYKINTLADLDEYETVALEYLSDVDKGRYEAFKGVLIEPTSAQKNDWEFQLGRSEKRKRLREAGLMLALDAAKEMAASAKQKGDEENYQKFTIEADNLKNRIDNLYSEFEDAGVYDTLTAAKEIVGIGGAKGAVEQVGQTLGAAIIKTGKGAWDLFADRFRSEEELEIENLRALGLSKQLGLDTYIPQSLSSEKTFEFTFDPEFKEQVWALRNDPNLPYQEKLAQVSSLLSRNRGKWTRTAIEPKANITGKGLLLSTANLGANLIPYIGINAVTGGGASASTARIFASEFGAAALTMYEDYKMYAAENDLPNPEAYAFKATIINGLANAVGGTAAQIRNAAKGLKDRSMRESIMRLSDDEILQALRTGEQVSPTALTRMKGLVRNAKQQALPTAKKVADNITEAGKLTGILQTGEALTQLSEGEELDPQQILRNFWIGTLNFTTLQNALNAGALAKFNKNDNVKNAIFEAGKQPDLSKKAADNLLSKGKISKDEHSQIVKNIDLAQKVYDNTPLLNAKGKELTDKEARELVFLKMQEADLEGVMSKSLPKELQDKVASRLVDIQTKIDEVYKGTFIDNVILDGEKKDTKLSQPIEGLDEQGVPIPKPQAEEGGNETQSPLEPIAEPEAPQVKGTPEEISQPVELALPEIKVEANEPNQQQPTGEGVAEQVSEPLQPDATKPKAEGSQESLPTSVEPISGTTTEAATPVLETGTKQQGSASNGSLPPNEGGGGEGAPPVSLPRLEGTGRQRMRAVATAILRSDVVTEGTKRLVKENGEYDVQTQEEANRVGDAIIESIGETQALEALRQGLIKDAMVQSSVYSKLSEMSAIREKQLRESGKIKEADAESEYASDIMVEYAEKATEAGRFISQISFFYKTSPLALAKAIDKANKKRFEDFASENEAGWQEAFTEFMRTEQGEALMKERVEEELKKERATYRKARDKKVDDAIDGLINDLKGLSTAQILPITPAVVTILKGIKVLYKAGSKAADIVADTMLALEKELGVGNFDKDAVAKKVEAMVKNLDEGVPDRKELTDEEYNTLRFKNLTEQIDELKKQIAGEKSLEPKAKAQRRKLTEEVKKLEEERNELRKEVEELRKQKKLGRYSDEAKNKAFLKRFGKKLEGLNNEQRQEVIRRASREIIEKGGLSYDEFKGVIAEVMGLRELSPTQVKEIQDLVAKGKAYDEALEAMTQNPESKELRDKARKLGLEAAEASRDLDAMFANEATRTDLANTFLKLGLISPITLINNVVSNVMKSGLMELPTYASKYLFTRVASAVTGKEMDMSSRVAWKGYSSQFKRQLQRAAFNFSKGTQSRDIFGEESQANIISPKQAKKELEKAKRGEIFLTKEQRFNRWLRSTWIARQHDLTSRALGFGDLPFRGAAEGATAFQIGAIELGISNPEVLEAYIFAPDKLGKKLVYEKLLSEEEGELTPQRKAILEKQAKEIADEYLQRIGDAGKAAVFQQENIVSKGSRKIDEVLRVKKDDNLAMKFGKQGASVLKTLSVPFVVYPANFYYANFKLNNPIYTFSEMMVYASMYYNEKRKPNNQARTQKMYNKVIENLGYLATGIAWQAFAKGLIEDGLIRGSITEEDTAKESSSKQTYERPAQFNLGAYAWGEDFWVDLKWLGPLGSVFDTQVTFADAKKARIAKEGESEETEMYKFMDESLEKMGISFKTSLNNVILNGITETANVLTLKDGSAQRWVASKSGQVEGALLGAAYIQVSKAALPYKPQTNVPNEFWESMVQNEKSRNILLRAGMNMVGLQGDPRPKLDIWGDEIKVGGSAADIASRLFGMSKDQREEKAFAIPIYEDFLETQDPLFFPSLIQRKLKVGKKEVKLTGEQFFDLEKFVKQNRKMLVQIVMDGEGAKYNNLGENYDLKKKLLMEAYSAGKKLGMSQFVEKYPEFKDAEVEEVAVDPKSQEEFEQMMEAIKAKKKELKEEAELKKAGF